MLICGQSHIIRHQSGTCLSSRLSDLKDGECGASEISDTESEITEAEAGLEVSPVSVTLMGKTVTILFREPILC